MLALADKIDSGLSKWRGQLLFELQSSAVILAQRALEENRITNFQAKVSFLTHSYKKGIKMSKFTGSQYIFCKYYTKITYQIYWT